MKHHVPVSEIMSTALITLNPKQSLYEAEKLFNRHNIRHIPIVENDRLVGMLSHTDLLRLSFADLVENDEFSVPVIYEMFGISDVMTRVPVFVEANYTIKETAEMLSKRSFHSLPVLDDGILVGIVTTTDLINYLLAQYSQRNVVAKDTLEHINDTWSRILPYAGLKVRHYQLIPVKSY